MLAKGSGLPISLSFIPFIVIAGLSYLAGPIVPIYSLIFLLLPVFTLYFFRDPDRKTGEGIVSPADGKVVSVDEKNNIIEIFMSPFDVHVNRMPISGRIENIKNISGDHHPAYSDKSIKNEKRKMIISSRDDSTSELTIWQITGIFARRIVSYVGEGESLEKGQRFGMIRFGSKVRVELPDDTRITAEMGEKLKAGESRIADEKTNKKEKGSREIYE